VEAAVAILASMRALIAALAGVEVVKIKPSLVASPAPLGPPTPTWARAGTNRRRSAHDSGMPSED